MGTLLDPLLPDNHLTHPAALGHTYTHPAGSFCRPAVSCQEQILKVSHREIIIRIDQLETKPRNYFSAFLNSQERHRGKGAEIRGRVLEVSFSYLRRLSCVGRGIIYGTEWGVLCVNILGDEFPLSL